MYIAIVQSKKSAPIFVVQYVLVFCSFHLEKSTLARTNHLMNWSLCDAYMSMLMYKCDEMKVWVCSIPIDHWMWIIFILVVLRPTLIVLDTWGASYSMNIILSRSWDIIQQNTIDHHKNCALSYSCDVDIPSFTYMSLPKNNNFKHLFTFFCILKPPFHAGY